MYKQDRKAALREFERSWLSRVAASGRSISQVARDERMDRVYLHKLLRRHGIKWGLSIQVDMSQEVPVLERPRICWVEDEPFVVEFVANLPKLDTAEFSP